MYPNGELNTLRLRKSTLRRRIAVTRLECVTHAMALARPLSALDQAVATWRSIQPWAKIAAVPLSFLFVRSFGRKFRVMRTLLKWGPLAAGVVRSLTKSPRPPKFERSRAA